MALAITTPFPQFYDLDGDPLDNGSLYFGVVNQNPETSPIVVYWDAAATQPAAQPIRTINGYPARNGAAALLYTNSDYSLTVRNRRGRRVLYAPSSAETSNSFSLLAMLAAFATAVGSTLIGWIQEGFGAVLRTVSDKLRESVSVKDFGAVGTANPANAAADNAAFQAALATGKNVFIPQGTYYISQTVSIGYGQKVYGAGKGKTTVNYSGTGNAFYLGGPGNTTLIYDCELHDLTVNCTNRATTVNGVYLDNAVYFRLSNLNVYGSGSPNSGVPADRVLYGSGVVVTNNSIIGSLRGVSCRLWNSGRFYNTLATGPSFWSAGIVDGGQGELGNNMFGISIGTNTGAYATAASVTFSDLCLQGNYTYGAINYTGDTVTFRNCYFEGNANYDIVIGSGVGIQPNNTIVTGCRMDSADIGTTNYGTFPYLAKVLVSTGTNARIELNNMSIATSIPLVTVGATASETTIEKNRLNSAIAAASRINNLGSVSVYTANNNPEAPRVYIGSFTRTLSAASGSVTYSGVGFRPTSIEFLANVDTLNLQSIGWASASAGIQSACNATLVSGAVIASGDCIRAIRDTVGTEQKAVLSTMTNDGFTLTWTLVGSPPGNDLNVRYIARR